jgi:pimeloyl-ACP methyl ester carboxylesterase
MKPTLLLLHGALGSPATLQPLAEQLQGAFTLKTLAFAGHGGRAVNEDQFSLDYFAGEVLEFLQAEEAGPVHVFGYSMGGYAALLAALREPARFASLTTLGTKLDWSPESAAVATRFLDPEKMQAKVPAFAEHLRQLHAPADWQAVVRATARLMQAAGTAPPLTPDSLAALAVPVQMLVGEQDDTAGPEASAAFAAHLPQGRFEVLSSTPHPLERANLTELSHRIQQFAGQYLPAPVL